MMLIRLAVVSYFTSFTISILTYSHSQPSQLSLLHACKLPSSLHTGIADGQYLGNLHASVRRQLRSIRCIRRLEVYFPRR
jgi:hypothetical protein